MMRTLLLMFAAFSLSAASAQDQSLRATKVLGMEVENRQGARLGKVHDLLVDLEKGKVTSLVVDTGRTLFGHPMREVSAAKGKLVVDAEPAVLAGRGFAYDKWPDYEAPYWAMVSPQPGGLPAPASGVRYPPPAASGGASAQAEPRIVRASRLLDANVKDIVFDVAAGNVHYVVMENGGSERQVKLDELTMRGGKLVRGR